MSSPVEQIKSRLGVVDVVGSYIKIQKAGANFKACCPFHNEKTPSFYISPSREIWHCFGCGKGGDLFEFVKEIEGVEFVEALRILADRAGVVLTRQNPELRNERTQLLNILKDATFFYQKQLAQNREALNYLWKRGLKNETLKQFNIGLAPEEEHGWRNLANYLKSKGYSPDEMEKVGLVIKKTPTEHYDRFRSRIMFPLKDGSGRVVGFSGRVFGALAQKEDVGKYINTPQTPLYDKSKILCGFDLAKMDIRKKDACILVEGQMDVIMSHQAGIKNAIAVSGTALTEDHLQAIKRLTNNLVMSFDNDDAGIEAAKRSINIALQRGFDVKAISLPGAKDPADLILENVEKWIEATKNAAHIVEFLLNVFKKKCGEDARKFKLEAAKNILPYIASIESEIDKGHWVKEFAKQTGSKEDAVFAELAKIKSFLPVEEGSAAPIKKENQKTRIQSLGEKIAGITAWKGYKEKAVPGLSSQRAEEQVFNILKEAKKEDKNRWILEAELCYADMKDNDLEKEISQLAGEFKKEMLKTQQGNLVEEISQLEAQGKTSEAEKKIIELQKTSRELAKL